MSDGTLRPGATALAGLALLISPMAGPGADPEETPPNVLLVTIDTLRADRLGSYGYVGAATPTLDRLAREGVRFADATVQVPLTVPSHVSILTGLLPHRHGVHDNGAETLGAGPRHVAEQFQKAGYRTGAFVGCALLGRRVGLSRGFDRYDDEFQEGGSGLGGALAERGAGEVAGRARRWVGAQTGRPWFVWVHFYDPHAPYNPPAPYAARFRGRPYDGEIAYVDQALGQLVTAVRASSPGRRVLVVVTSDHGESLGEHDEDEHGFFAYDATLHVPLIVWDAPGNPSRARRLSRPARLEPGREAGLVVTEQVRSVDIMPTLLALAGIPGPSGIDGESLASLIEGGHRSEVPPSYAETLYAQRHFGWAPLRAVRVPGWKFIDAPRSELYDLRRDPGEQRNLTSERPALVSRLKALLDAESDQRATPAAAAVGQPDAETFARLRSLGYVGAMVPSAAATAGADPKDHVRDYWEFVAAFKRGMAALGRRPAAAAASFARAAAVSPSNFEARDFEGRALLELGDYSRALEAFTASAAGNPAYLDAYLGQAVAYAGLQQATRAREAVRIARSIDPHSYDARFTAGLIEERLGNAPEAAAAYREAVEIDPRDPRAHANLAESALRLGRLEEATREYEALVALGYRVAGAEFNLGAIAEQQDDPKRAIAHYRRALAREPRFQPAARALARLTGSNVHSPR